MSAKHTPGPWRELVTRIDDANGYQICHLDLHGKTETERDANRRLIAAAPDLLEALQYAIKQVPELSTVPGISAAIAKATGEAA